MKETRDEREEREIDERDDQEKVCEREPVCDGVRPGTCDEGCMVM